MALTEAQQEAAELATAIIDFAQGIGWDIDKKGVNKTYAWVRLTHPWHEGLQAFYSVDPDTTEDKFIYGTAVIPLEALKVIITAASSAALIDLALETGKQWGRDITAMLAGVEREDAPVPPTSAAHSAAHPDGVPPTEGSAAHVPPTVPPTVEEAQSAAHTRALNDAAHDAGEVPVPPTVEGDVPPIGGGGYTLLRRLDDNWQETDELDREDLMEARQEAKKHLEQAGQPAAQLDTIAAVEAQYASPRNWSPVASPLTTEELLAKVPGKTITFRNRQSGRLDESTVCTNAEAKRYTPKITPEGFDAERVGEDLRIIHFLQLGAGFRSIAVSQITEIN